MTDIDYDTWMLSGSAVMRDGQTVRNGYCCDLNTLGGKFRDFGTSADITSALKQTYRI